jgi:hypothetical protein
MMCRKANAPVNYLQCGETFRCLPLVLELIGKQPGDRIATFDESAALSASETAHSRVRDCICKARMSSLRVVGLLRCVSSRR